MKASHGHPLARKVVSQMRPPVALAQRERLEKEGFIDLASSLGVRLSSDREYPRVDQSSIRQKISAQSLRLMAL